MSTSEDHILREQRPIDSLIPPLDVSLELSKTQIEFLLHAIHDVNPEAVDAEAKIKERVLEVQRKAYEVYPYPCIRGFQHVYLFMSENNAFPYILKIAQSAGQANVPLLLDLGCCMGTDLRHVVHSGYPSTAVIGCDVRGDFIDLGHALYADRDACSIPFFVGDVLDITLRAFPQAADDACPSLKDVRSLNELFGRVKYIYAGSLFHLFDEGTQEAIARRLVTLLDVTEENGPAVLFGRHVAKENEGLIDDAMGRPRYAHSPASWGELWERVLGGKIRVRVHAEFPFEQRSTSDMVNPGRGTKIMWWNVWVG